MKKIKASIMSLSVMFAGAAYADTFYVTKYDDTNDGVCDEDCSLREAITQANMQEGEDTIILNSGRYLLGKSFGWGHANNNHKQLGKHFKHQDENENQSGDLDITDDLTIMGALDGSTVIDARHRSRVFEIIQGNVNLDNLTITGGLSNDGGAGLVNYGNTVLYNSRVVNNLSYSKSFEEGSGGGISNYGELSIFSSDIEHNSVVALKDRAAGGGVANFGMLTVRDSNFTKNKALGVQEGFGGGISNRGLADIRRSLFTGNAANGWHMGLGTALINSDGGETKIVSSTFSQNNTSADTNLYHRAAIANGISDYDGSEIYITNSTIVDNKGFGFVNHGHSYIKNSVVAANGFNFGGFLPALNCYNSSDEFSTVMLALGSGNNPGCSADLEFDDATTFTEQLEPLADQHNHIMGYFPMATSILVDAANSPCPMYDQLGQSAPADGNGDGVAACDIGAIELQP